MAQDTRTRRNVLKTLGITSGAIALSTGVSVAASDKKSAGNDYEITLHPNTGEYETLDEVVVKITEKGNVQVSMGGTVPPDAPSRSYTVDIRNLRNDRDELTPNRAWADVKRSSVKFPEPDTVGEVQGHRYESEGGEGGSDSAYRPKMRSSSLNEGINTQGSDGGSDGGNNYKGGCWVASQDPVNLPLCGCRNFLDWSVQNGNVNWIDYHWEWAAYEYYAPPSDWNLDDIRWTGTDWSGSDVDHSLAADFINWTWQYNHNSTHAHHRSTASGNPNGSMNWYANWWHNGEDAGILDAMAGHINR